MTILKSLTTISNLMIDPIVFLGKRWLSSGLQKGEILLLHSNITRTLRILRRNGYEPKVTDILESFLWALGDEGTLLLPLFNFDFTKGVSFDIRHTPSQMGSLTEEGRLHAGAVRTGHPIYSFVALGKQKERFRNINNKSAYGNDSPFAILRQLNGKIGILDLPDQHSMTFYHHVEEMTGVTYRYQKMFRGNYTDMSGKTTPQEYSIFVRDLEKGVKTHVNPMGDLLWEKGLYQGDRPGVGSGLRIIDANAAFAETAAVIRSGRAKGILYEI